MELINQTSAILTQSAELIKNPAISGTITSMFSWLKNVFKNNKRAKERIELIEKTEANEDTINQLKTNLDDVLYNNKNLQKELLEKVKEIELLMKNEGIQNISKSNTINVTGSSNKIMQGITISGDFKIN